MSRLYAVSKTHKSPQQEAREAVKRHRKRSQIDYAKLRNSTIREGAGMKWLPVWFRYWWKQEVIRLPTGDLEVRLGYKR